MKHAELRDFLKRYQLSQDDFAKMVGASLRSVSSWLAEGGSDIPGPAEAYTRLFAQLSEYGRQLEIGRAKGRGVIMRDGVFLMSYSSLGLPGWCTLTLDRGVAYGFDMAGGMYDGTYAFDPERRVADVELAVTVPPNVATLWGPAKPYTWSFAVTAAFDPNADEGLSRLTNTLGVPDADVAYRFIRPLPARGIFADGDMSFAATMMPAAVAGAQILAAMRPRDKAL